MSNPGEGHLPVMRRTEIGRFGAVTMTSPFRQRTKIHLGIGMKVTGVDGSASPYQT